MKIKQRASERGSVVFAVLLLIMMGMMLVQILALNERNQYVLFDATSAHLQEVAECASIESDLEHSVLLFQDTLPDSTAFTSGWTVGKEFATVFNTDEQGSGVGYGYGSSQIGSSAPPSTTSSVAIGSSSQASFASTIDSPAAGSGWIWPGQTVDGSGTALTGFNQKSFPSGWSLVPVSGTTYVSPSVSVVSGGFGYGSCGTFFPSPSRPILTVTHLPNGGFYDSSYASAASAYPNNSLLGLRQMTTQLLMEGPMQELTSGSVENLSTHALFSGTVCTAPSFNRYDGHSGNTVAYSASCRMFCVPITNFNYVEYGLPTGLSSAFTPSMASGVGVSSVPVSTPTSSLPFGVGAKPLIVTSNNPNHDATAFSDLWTAPLVDSLPHRYQGQVSAAEHLYECLWSWYIPQVLSQNGAYKPSIYDMQTASPSIPGFTQTLPSTSLAVSLDSMTAVSAVSGTGVSGLQTQVSVSDAAVLGSTSSSCYVVLDAAGGGSVTLSGSGLSTLPIVVVVRGLGATPTSLHVVGGNTQPVLLYCTNCTVNLTGTFSGGIILDPQCTMLGSGSISGHLSLWWANGVSGGYTVPWTVYANQSVEWALSDVAPRFMVVAGSVTRH